MNRPDKSFKYNSVPEQKLYSPAQLTIVSWNNIINQLRTQGNELALYLNQLHSYLFDENIIIPDVVSSTKNGLISSSMYLKYEGYEADIQNKVNRTEYEEALSNKVNISDYEEALSNKVDKVSGKGLSTNDFTDASVQIIQELVAFRDNSIQSNYITEVLELPAQSGTLTSNQLEKLPRVLCLLCLGSYYILDHIDSSYIYFKRVYNNGHTTTQTFIQIRKTNGSYSYYSYDIPDTSYVSSHVIANQAGASSNVYLEKLTIGSNIYLIKSYSNQSAAESGTTLSLVTTGEKYIWNNKQDPIVFNTAYNASTNKAATMADIVSVYKPQGNATVAELNALTKTNAMNGFVYNLTAAGDLTNSDNTTTSVMIGDNVALIFDESAYKWDALAATVDLSNYATLTQLNTKQDVISDLASIRSTANSAVQPSDLSIYALKPTIETFTISSWIADSNISPYTYKATITLTTTILTDTIVELLNNDPILFANYGFAIGSISGQVATIYSLDEPDSSVTLKIKVGD